MRGVNFDDLKSSFQRTTRRNRKRFHYILNSLLIESEGLRVGLGKRDGARRYRLPTAFRFGDRCIAFPRTQRTSFPSSVSQLNSGNATLLAKETSNSRESLDVFVFINPQVLRTDAPLGRNRRRFGENERGSSHRPAAQMHKVPIVGKAIDTRI